MQKRGTLSPGWLRGEIDSAITEIEGRKYISQGLRELLQSAADSIKRSDCLMRPKVGTTKGTNKKSGT